MNQTTLIAGGGVAVVLLSVLLYMTTGSAPTSPAQVTPVPEAEIAVTPETTPVDAPKDITQTPPKKMEPNTSPASSAILHTSMGDITLKFYPIDAPKTVENFLKLAREGFYDGVKFHRVIKGFMNQTGDPLSKDDSQAGRWGTGGPGYKFADEINTGSAIYQRGYKVGVLAMANSGPDTNGSQFFIMAADYPLPPLYTIFGEVTAGLDVVAKINEVKTSQDRPLTPVVITSVEVK